MVAAGVEYYDFSPLIASNLGNVFDIPGYIEFIDKK